MRCNKCLEEIANSSKYCKQCGALQLQTVPNSKGINDTVLIPTSGAMYAGFMIRLGAYLADFLVLVIFIILIGIAVNLLWSPDKWNELNGSLGWFADYFYWFIYSLLFLTTWSKTPGKALYGLEVLRENGQKLDFSTSLLRVFCQPFSLLFFGAGYWNMDKDEKKLTWHDKQAHTIVIVNKKKNYVFPIIISILGLVLYIYARSL